MSVHHDGQIRFGKGRFAVWTPVLAALSCVLYCFNGELLQALTNGSASASPSPLLNLILCHLGGLVFAPHFILWQPPVRSSADTLCKALDHIGSSPRLASLFFALLLMGYNYAWLLSTRFITAGLTNALFQSSIAFVYVASVLFFGETVTGPRLLGVLLSLMGSAFASGVGTQADELEPEPAPQLRMRTGVLLALMASVGITLYQVLFKLLFGHLKRDARFLAYFGSWVSVWHILVILPAVLVASLTGFEHLHFPHGLLAVTGTAVSAAIASTVNALQLCLVMWGSPMLFPCSNAFSVPLTVALDFALHGVRPTGKEVAGHLMVVASVVLIMELYKELHRPGGTRDLEVEHLPVTEGSRATT